MARPLRIIEPGLWHHVTHRGLRGMRVFEDDTDRETFVELVAECAERWALRTAAFVLLDDRYHLLVRDDTAALSRALRHVTGVYTQRFNRRRDSEGPLFHGRFRSRVVQPGAMALQIVRHLHILPVRADRARRAGDYPWSSHRLYLAEQRPDFLHDGEVWLRFGGDVPAGRRRFDAFVHEPPPAELAPRLEGDPWNPLLGDEAFEAAWRDRLRADPRYQDRQLAGARQLRARTVDEVIDAALEAFDLDPATLMASARGRLNLPRMVCMMVCRDHTAATLAELGDRFGISGGAVSALASRTRNRLRDDPDAEALHGRLMARLTRPVSAPPRPDPTGLRDHIGRIAD
jgi:putative transposase